MCFKKCRFGIVFFAILWCIANSSQLWAQTDGVVKRNIKVCLVQDGIFPVKSFVEVERALRIVSREFDANVGITFSVFKQLDYPYILGDDYGIARSLKSECSGSDMRLVFSNDRIGFHRGDTLYLQGHASPEFGHALFYNAGRYAVRHDAGGNDILVIALMHEIAHLFGAKHELNKNSFMYPNATESFGKWTPDATEAVSRNRLRQWGAP